MRTISRRWRRRHRPWGRRSIKLAALMKEKEETEALLEEKMERWMYLNDLAERIAEQNGR